MTQLIQDEDFANDAESEQKPLQKLQEESTVKSFVTTFATVLTGVANALETGHR